MLSVYQLPIAFSVLPANIYNNTSEFAYVIMQNIVLLLSQIQWKWHIWLCH